MKILKSHLIFSGDNLLHKTNKTRFMRESIKEFSVTTLLLRSKAFTDITKSLRKNEIERKPINNILTGKNSQPIKNTEHENGAESILEDSLFTRSGKNLYEYETESTNRNTNHVGDFIYIIIQLNYISIILFIFYLIN